MYSYVSSDNTADELDQAELLSKPWRETVDWANPGGVSDSMVYLSTTRVSMQYNP